MNLMKKVMRSARICWHEVPFLLRDAGILPGECCYARHIILARSRVGSNLLNSLLNTHPAIVSYGEIFRNDYSIGWDRGGMPSGSGMVRLMNNEPVGFLEKKVFRTFPPKTRAVGFKLFYYHAQDEKRKVLWDYLIADRDLQVIHLRRKNMLKTLVSLKRAWITDKWVRVSLPEKKSVTVRLDAEECINFFEQNRQWEQEARENFSSHHFMEVVYEEMVRDKPAVARELHEFLGVPSVQITKPVFKKQNRHNLRDSIENYDEIAEALSGTEWSSFLDE